MFYILQFYYDRNTECSQVSYKVCFLSARCIIKKIALEYFCCFRSGNFDVKNDPLSDRQIAKNVDEIIAKFKQGQHVSGHNINNKLNIHH